MVGMTLMKEGLGNVGTPAGSPAKWKTFATYVHEKGEKSLGTFKNFSYFCPQNKRMNKNTVIKRLSSLKVPLMAVGVSQLGLFGSTVRGENTLKSDIDILIDFNAGQETYHNFIDACTILQNAFGKKKLDVVTVKGLSPYIGEMILKEVEYV